MAAKLLRSIPDPADDRDPALSLWQSLPLRHLSGDRQAVKLAAQMRQTRA